MPSSVNVRPMQEPSTASSGWKPMTAAEIGRDAAACRADLELMARAADGSSASPKRNAAWPGRKSQLKNRRKINQG